MSDTVTITETTETVTVLEDNTVVTMPVQSVEVVTVGIQGPAGTGIYVGTTPPSSPAINQLWVDTN